MISSIILKIKENDIYENMAIGLAILFLILLLIFNSFHEIGGYGVETDFYGAYASRAEALLTSDEIHWEDHGPGYILFLVLFNFILGDMFVGAKFISILAGMLFCYFSFLTLKTIFNSKLAFYTLILLLIQIFPYSILASTDMFFAFLIALSSYFIYRKNQFSYSNLVWGGLIAGFAYMTRINAVILPLAIITSVILINPEKWKWNQKIKAIVAFGIAFLVTASPWLIMNTMDRGNPFASEAYQTIGSSMLGNETASGDFSWGETKDAVAAQYSSIVSLILSNLLIFINFFVKNVLNYFNRVLFELIKFPAFMFVAPGAILLFSRINRIQLSYFVISVYGFLIYCMIMFYPRFYIYILSFFLFFVVYFIFYRDFSKADSPFMKKFIMINKSIFVLIVLFALKNSGEQMKYNITTEPIALIKVSEELKKVCNDEEIIIARKPQLGYLSGIKTVLFPDAKSFEELIDYSLKNNADYLLYSDVEAELRPKFIMLQNPENVPQGLKLVYFMDQPRIVLYKIVPNNGNMIINNNN